VASFAIVLCSRPATLDGVLMILDDRHDADEIAFELNRRGQEVDVVEVVAPHGLPVPEPTTQSA
jgi:hypothetical protein